MYYMILVIFENLYFT